MKREGQSEEWQGNKRKDRRDEVSGERKAKGV